MAESLYEAGLGHHVSNVLGLQCHTLIKIKFSLFTLKDSLCYVNVWYSELGNISWTCWTCYENNKEPGYIIWHTSYCLDFISFLKIFNEHFKNGNERKLVFSPAYFEWLMIASRNNLWVPISRKIEDWHCPSNDQTQALGKKKYRR